MQVKGLSEDEASVEKSAATSTVGTSSNTFRETSTTINSKPTAATIPLKIERINWARKYPDKLRKAVSD